MKQIFDFILSHKEAVGTTAVFFYEILLRVKPTAKDWSIINIVKRLFDIIPNKAPQGDVHK
ncbi:MAG: hypothetical protein M0Q26_05925 [Chitinophagaceae bacterium]|nr:hypothetical protein [Chitinophagaceae bacterium]MDP1763421.1 hypothetical protein [Sediminibacterium sp.]